MKEIVKEMIMKKTLTVFAIFAVIGLFAVDSFAQSFQGRRTGRARLNRSSTRIIRVLKANQEELKITEDQLKGIEDLTYSFEEKKIEARSEAGKSHLELRKLMQDRGNVDYAKLKDALSKASEHKHNMVIDGLKLKDEIDKVLTPEQKEALKSMRQERFKDRRDSRGRGAGRVSRGRMQRPPSNRQQIKKDF
jgi:Spy/CpxP family protein refolding chaperone